MIYLGLDLGQRRDHSALAIVERRLKVTSRMDYAKWRQAEQGGRFWRWTRRAWGCR